MGMEFGLIKMYSATKPAMDLVLLHGLTGDPLETWNSESSESFWPTWLAGELPNLNIYTLKYPASLMGKWAKKEMDLFERCNNILENMAGIGLGTRPIVLIAHSLGGIVAKQILRSATQSSDSDYKAIAQSIKLIIFLGTPHTGASLANVLNLIPGSSKHIKLLSNELGFLEDLNSYYRDFAVKNPDLKTVVYYEKFKTKNLLEIVDRSSADPGVTGTQPVPLDKDHINICKPKDQDDVVYIGVKRHVKKVYDTATLSVTEQDDYTVKSTSDRRDLLTKLIDADREQEYSIANEYQNNFARKIVRFGLYTKARDDHDSLLTEIESRFNLHIYHPLICKEASDVEISSAIQTLIIDPLIQKNIGGTLFNSKDILSGLYYLTEQCHIRWDPISKC